MAIGLGYDRPGFLDNENDIPDWRRESRLTVAKQPDLPVMRVNQRTFVLGKNLDNRFPHEAQGVKHKGNMKLTSIGRQGEEMKAECVMGCGLVVRVVPKIR